jgi:aspartyl-tRNA(Asn)/glutamyl-tRNA(Gln) amidotransferase subunit A
MPPDRATDLALWSATDLIAGYRDRSVSPVEATQAALARIERLDPALNAFCLVDRDGALAAARAAAARWQRGAPLGLVDGVPTTVKDIVLTKGWPTLRGSKTVDPKQSWDEDAPAVARLREHGAVLLGKTTTSEFGLKGLGDSPLTGVTHNPWDLAHTPGGSSAGAVAAVAAGFGPLAVGTDGGGSIRVPSAFSGVVGLKPTFGVVPQSPPHLVGVPPHVGPIAHNVEDAALLLSVLSGPDSRDPFRAPLLRTDYRDAEPRSLEGVSIGYSKTLGFAEVSEEVAALFERAVGVFRSLGAAIEPSDPGFARPAAILQTLFWGRAALTVQKLSSEQRAQLDPAIEASAQQGERLSALDYLQAEARRIDLAEHLARYHQRFDLLLTPAIAGVAPKHDAPDALAQLGQRAPFAGAFSLTRQPAISIPVGVSAGGLPIAIQIAGRHFEDARVLAAARAFERSPEAQAFRQRAATLRS